MKCPKCGVDQSDFRSECVKCGLIFSRYRPPEEREMDYPPPREPLPSLPVRFMRYMLHTRDRIKPIYFTGRLLVLIFIAAWSVSFFQSSLESNYAGRSFMHLVNLPFHEAGHILFSPLGGVMQSLGGSLGQLIMPVTCMLVLLVKTRDTFGASMALWWTGESLLDMAPYINDASAMRLHLLGGNTGADAPYGFHDWNYILSELDMLSSHGTIARLAEAGGKALMGLAILWGLTVLIRQMRRLRRTKVKA